ncbi:MAG: PLP-dependent aminotransferase family protein [Terriglobales bacterium]
MIAADGILPLIPLDRAAARPLHQQICDGFRSAIARGELRAGQRIPSSRQLAVALGLSRMPVVTAYAQLAAEGYCEAHAGGGTCICPALAGYHQRRAELEQKAQHPDPSPRPLSALAARLPRYERLPWSGLGAFSVHQPALDQFPYATWARLVARHARTPPSGGLRRMDPGGYVCLREAIAAYLRTARAVNCDPGQVLITNGSQQAVDLCARLLCDRGTPVWFEEPGYWLARQAFQAAGARLIPVPVDENGMDVNAALRRSPRARVAFVAPSHQYPLGATLSAARRFQLLDWAEQAGAWIIEDDYDGEYRFSTMPVESLQGLDPNRRVLYIGTFSKVMYPSLRLGYLVLPPNLVNLFTAARQTADICSSLLYQLAMADFITAGHFARHIQRMRRLYAARQAALAARLHNQLGPAWTLHGEGAGMHLTIATASRCPDRQIAMEAARQKLWLWPLSPSYLQARPRMGFILGCANTDVEAMPAAVARLRMAIARG